MSNYDELKRLAEAATIGDKPASTPIKELIGAQDAFRSECRPEKVLALIAENERLESEAVYSAAGFDAAREEIARLKAEIAGLRTGYQAYEQVNAELKAEMEGLRKDRTDWQAECLKRGFEYVRESDDHYVLADVPEMADLLGLMLGVEVRSKENHAYEEANSQLNEQIEGLINTIHSQESVRKDAERYRWLRDGAGYCDTRDIPGMAPARMDAFIDAAMDQGEQS